MGPWKWDVTRVVNAQRVGLYPLAVETDQIGSKSAHTATLNTVQMSKDLAPGDFVRHPTEVRWGLGQVQSVVGDRVTVSFENRGKVLINSAIVSLILTADGATASTHKD